MQFCVEEGSEKRRRLAEMLGAEDGEVGGTMGRSLECGVVALPAKSMRWDRARQWWENWASPKKRRLPAEV